jgi:enolase
MRDNDAKINLGKSVYKAVENVNTILRSALLGKDYRDQKGIDKLMSE